MENPTPDNLENRIIALLEKKLLSVSQIAKELKINRVVAGGYMEALRNQGKLELYKVCWSTVSIIARGRK